MALTLRGAALPGLADLQRPGRPRRFTPVQRAQVTAIACELPATRGMPLSRWSSSELAGKAIEAGWWQASPLYGAPLAGG
jgi:hypothetical protein